MLSDEALSMFVDRLYSQQRTRKTVIGYRSDLLKFERYYVTKYNGPWLIEDTTTEDLEEFMRMLMVEQNLGAATRARVLSTLKSFFHFMIYKKVCNEDVTYGIELPKQRRREREFLSEAQIKTFIRAIEHPIVRVASTTLAYTGMRISECCDLRVEDVNFDTATIHVRNGKGQKDRSIPIAPVLRADLVAYVREYRTGAQPHHRFFANKGTGKLSPSYFDNVLAQTSKKLGMKKNVSAHVFRHSFASNLARRGVHVVLLQKLLGHSSLQVTSIYTHATIEDLATAVTKLHM